MVDCKKLIKHGEIFRVTTKKVKQKSISNVSKDEKNRIIQNIKLIQKKKEKLKKEQQRR